MATLAQIKTIVDDWLAARWPTVQSKQTLYAATHDGRYFQGRWTHLINPTDGVDGSPDNTDVKPTDQAEWWAEFLVLPLQYPCSIRMDVYQNDSGWGYVLTVRVHISALGRVYERSQNGAGTETWRTVAWHEIAP